MLSKKTDTPAAAGVIRNPWFKVTLSSQFFTAWVTSTLTKAFAVFTGTPLATTGP